VAGQLVSRFGKWKRYLVGGGILLILGLGLSGTLDHSTNLGLVGVYTFIFGLGLGMMMQNLVLAVQNTVAAKDIGSASGSVAFFRTVGGAAGVSVLGAVLGTHVTDLITTGLRNAGVPITGSGTGVSLDVKDLPAPIAEIVRAAYGDGTGLIFTISAFTAVAALVAVLFIKEVELRRTVDIVQAGKGTSPAPGLSAELPQPQQHGAGNGLDRELADVLSGGNAGSNGRGASSGESVHAAATRNSSPLVDARPATDARSTSGQQQKHAAGTLTASAQLAEAEAQMELAAQIQVTQRLLAEQQLQLSSALTAVGEQSAQLRVIAERQAASAAKLEQLGTQLAKERELQKAAAEYLAQQHAQLQDRRKG
jgi:hypothetical protein